MGGRGPIPASAEGPDLKRRRDSLPLKKRRKEVNGLCGVEDGKQDGGKKTRTKVQFTPNGFCFLSKGG